MWIWSSLTTIFFSTFGSPQQIIWWSTCDFAEAYFVLLWMAFLMQPVPFLQACDRQLGIWLEQTVSCPKTQGSEIEPPTFRSTSWAFLPFLLQQHWILVYQENMNLNVLGRWRAVGIDILTFFVNHRQPYLSRWRNERNRNSRQTNVRFRFVHTHTPPDSKLAKEN